MKRDEKTCTISQDLNLSTSNSAHFKNLLRFFSIFIDVSMVLRVIQEISRSFLWKNVVKSNNQPTISAWESHKNANFKRALGMWHEIR